MMGASKDEEADFIPGIFNYCDRWCERCPMTNRCLLFHRESLQRAEHYSKGEDPDDWAVVLNDVHLELTETMQMLKQSAGEEGIDLEEIAEDAEVNRPNISNHPLRIKAHRFAMDSHRYLDKLCTYIHEEEQKGISTDRLEDLQDCFQVLTWYHMQIAAKLDRALMSKLRKTLIEVQVDDASGSAKVAYIGLLKSLDALTKVYEWNKPMRGDIMPLLNTIYELTEEVNQEFPGHKTFKRPGFAD